MYFLGYPIEIWLAALVSVFIRLKYNKALTFLGTLTTVLVAIFAGVFMHEPIIRIMGISEDWTVFTAIVISLSAENLMKNVVELSDDREFIKDWIKHILTKGPRK